MGKRIRKTIGALLAVIAIAVTQIPVPDVEAENTAPTSDFQISGTTLVKYTGTAQDVSINGSVKKIESGAFANNDSIKNVVIGAGVEEIGAGAFEDCNNLKSVSISDDVQSIDQAAFAGCKSLKTVSIGSGLFSLGSGVFAGDTALGYVSFANNNEHFICEDGVITNAKGDTVYAVLAGRDKDTLALSYNTKKIMPYAFWGNKRLKTVEINGSVKEIPAYAFSNCTNLTHVEIPSSVNDIGVKAFEDCVRLRNITIPSTVRYIHDTAFDGCTRLNIDAEEGSPAKTFADNLVLEDIDISEYEDTDAGRVSDDIDSDDDSENDTESGESADSNDSGSASEPYVVDYYHEVTHMNPMETEEDVSVIGKGRILGSQTFVFVDNAKATVNSGDPNITALAGSSQGSNERIESILGNTGEKGGSFPKYTIVDGRIIANQAYYGDKRDVIEIPQGIEKIGDFAFARSGLTGVNIPEGVTDIGYAAFYHCDSLSNVEISSTVTYIAPYAFEETAWLNTWLAGSTSANNVAAFSANGVESGNRAEDFLIVGDGILLAYRGSGSIVTVPEGVKDIAPGAFTGHSEIMSVTLPASLETIGEGAFTDCSNLNALQGGTGLKRIKDRAFAGCPMSEIRIPASVEEVGLRAFDLTGTQVGSGTVIFEGSVLPVLSYEESSGKLYHEDYRGLAFTGIGTAVVPEGAKIEGSILDEAVYGFRGSIENGNVSGTNTVATASKAGSGTENLDSTTESEATQDAPAQGNGTVTVKINSSSISQDALALAVLDGAERDYTLQITDSPEAKQKIASAYGGLYGNQLPSNLQGFDITLLEAESGIPITALGKQQVEISIPVPTGIDETNLHVVCLDADGQLEEASSRIATVDGMLSLTFTTNHFSSYGIYNYISGDTAQVRDGQAVFTSLSGNLDDSPDTGDHSVHPKWFLGFGLLFTGLALFFYRDKRKI